MPILVLLSSVAVLIGTGIFAVGAARSPRATPIVYGLCLAACGVALAAALFHLFLEGEAAWSVTLPFGLPWLGARFRLDPLAAFFLIVVNLGGGAASLYGLGYGRHETAPHRLLPFFAAFLAGMNLVVIADDAFIFLLSWEFMSLTSWALVMTHHRDGDNARAGYIYLVMASFGTLALLLAFGLLAGPDGAYDFQSIRAALHAPSVAALVLALALLGAGSKAGIVPLHVWLPLAHPAAPSHVSALMSGVMTKVDLYDNTASLQDRTVATGVLGPALAAQYAAGGYVGRASGRYFDARRTPGYPPYDDLQFEVPVLQEGDVNARVWIRIREVDAGSCNGCELEIHALNNAFYDVERFGIRFVASPRHADVLLVTGPVTKNMQEAMQRTYDATPGPKWVVAAGDCAFDGSCFAGSYAVAGGVSAVLPVDLHIRGCPPSPTALLQGLLALLEKVTSRGRTVRPRDVPSALTPTSRSGRPRYPARLCRAHALRSIRIGPGSGFFSSATAQALPQEARRRDRPGSRPLRLPAV